MDRKKLFALAILILLIISISLTVYLVQKQQIFKSRATLEGTRLEFLDSQGNLLGSSTPSNKVRLKITYAAASPSPTPPPNRGDKGDMVTPPKDTGKWQQNTLFRSQVDQLLASPPEGTTIIGKDTPNEVKKLTPGETYQGDFIITNAATLELTGGGKTTLRGNVWILDKGTFRVKDADLDIPQEYDGQYSVYALDESRYEITDSKISYGSSHDNMLSFQHIVGAAKASMKGNNFKIRTPATPEVVIQDQGSFLADGNKADLFENTLAADASLDLRNQGAGVNFEVAGTIPEPLTLKTSAEPQTKTISVPNTKGVASINLVNAHPFFSLFVDSNAKFTLKDSNLGLFLTYSDQNSGSVKGVKPGFFSDQIVNMGNGSIRLVNTEVLLWIVYTEDKGSVTVEDSQLSEYGGSGSSNATIKNTTITQDVTVSGDTKVTIENSVIEASITTSGNSTLNIHSSQMRPGKGTPSPFKIGARGNSRVVLENTTVDPSVKQEKFDNGEIIIRNPSPIPPASSFPTAFRVANDSANKLSAATEQPFTSNPKIIDWELPEGAGQKTVFVQFKFGDSWQETISSQIQLVSITTPDPKLAVFYVSPLGDDNSSGTKDQPFKTLVKARDVIKTQNKNMASDITIFLRGGVHTLEKSFILTEEDSGTNGFFVVYRNYPGEIPLISGGRTITGWEKEGDLWKAAVDKDLQTRQFYVNGQRATRARSTAGLPGAQKNETGFQTSDLRMKDWQNISDIELVDKNEAQLFRCGIKVINGGNIEMKQPCWRDSQLAPETKMDKPDWIENAFELLDQPGEWYLNRATNLLYYKPRANEDMTAVQIIVPTLETLIKGEGTSDQPLNHIKFQGLIFAYATWLGPSSDKGNPDYWGNTMLRFNSYVPGEEALLEKVPANLIFKKARSIQFERNIFTRLGADAISFDEEIQESTISGNHFYDISGNAIQVGYFALKTDQKKIVKGSRISNNYIHKVGVDYISAVGIQIGGVQDTLITHNEIFDTPSSGIIIGWHGDKNDSTVNNNVEHNLIYDHMKETPDGGGIYSAGQEKGILITRNVIKNQRNPFGGLYLDLDSRYKEVSFNVSVDNVCCNGFFNGGDHYIHDNWWQDRQNLDNNHPDIWLYLPEKSFGPIRLENNQVIENISQAPAEILDKAGLEVNFKDIMQLPQIPITSSTPTPTPTVKPSPSPSASTIPNRFDLNNDGKINSFDAAIFLDGWKSGAKPPKLDFNNDKVINSFDWTILLNGIILIR